MPGVNTYGEALAAGRQLLEKMGIETAALDARLLLRAATGLEHADLILHLEQTASPMEINQYNGWLVRRARFEPVSRIIGMREFYGREFSLSPDVLDPRPDTETLVDLVLSRHGAETARNVIDLGSGSGAIIVTLLAERPLWTGTAVDISRNALAFTSINARDHGVAERLTYFAGSWFDGIAGLFDVIVSNPPYIRKADIAGLPMAVQGYDPHLALDGGADGLSCHRAIATGAARHLAPNGMIAVEIGAGQEPDVSGIFAARGLSLVESRPDLGGHVRGLAFRASLG